MGLRSDNIFAKLEQMSRLFEADPRILPDQPCSVNDDPKYFSYTDDHLAPRGGADIVGKLEQWTLEELQNRRRAIWTQKSTKARASRWQLWSMTHSQLQELARFSLMLQISESSSSSPNELLTALEASILDEVVQPRT